MSLNMGDQEYNSGKKYRQKGTLCGPSSNMKHVEIHAHYLRQLVHENVISHSTKDTIIDLFFEDTCLQVIQVWNTMISFIFWVIHDDVEVLQLIDYIYIYVDR